MPREAALQKRQKIGLFEVLVLEVPEINIDSSFVSDAPHVETTAAPTSAQTPASPPSPTPAAVTSMPLRRKIRQARYRSAWVFVSLEYIYLYILFYLLGTKKTVTCSNLALRVIT